MRSTMLEMINKKHAWEKDDWDEIKQKRKNQKILFLFRLNVNRKMLLEASSLPRAHSTKRKLWLARKEHRKQMRFNFSQTIISLFTDSFHSSKH